MSKAVLGKVFRHYKDPNKTYEIIKVVEGQSGLLDTVTYKQLYTSEGYPLGTLWVRLKKEFEGVVVKEGIVLERFSPV